ncbi:MAG TPA: hypothetical protein VHG71_04635 [Verrucomicrobiae bacterium]|nr:hypothetical protein [Verrucomicrobiae bacterium]
MNNSYVLPIRKAIVKLSATIGVVLFSYPAMADLTETPEVSSSLVPRIDQMPDLPQPFLMRDWHQVTRDYIDYLFDFDKHGDHLPLIRWLDTHQSMVWMPSYVGNVDGPESINYLGALVSGSLVGLDMRFYRGQDWVMMGTNFFSPKDGIFLDWHGGVSGESFWYDVLPNVLFYQLTDLYPSNSIREKLTSTVAERWYEAAVSLGGKLNPPALPDIDHTAFNFRTMQPFDNGARIEPEGAAGVAWIEYMAWRKSRDPRFQTAADWMIRALENKPLNANPLYEVLLPYAVITAARMNAEIGKKYDVTRLMNWCFQPRPAPQARPNWGVITGTWNGLDVDGLVGSVSDGGGYAFAMNTFEYVGTLAPLARYDSRYARVLGKWILNAANAARLFYSNARDAQDQSSYSWAATNDPESVIAYEGLRRWKREATVATADGKTSAGKLVQGSYISTHYYHDQPADEELLEESPSANGPRLEHDWTFDLPKRESRYLVVAASRLNGGHNGNAFRFSFADAPNGPFVEAFSVSGLNSVHTCKIPDSFVGKLYVRVESTDNLNHQAACDKLAVDAMAISSRADTGPYAQGDVRVTWVTLLEDYSVPIVLYRPESAATDLGLYGSSYVGNLGGILQSTDVDKIFQIDLLKTDYFHEPAYPTYLYYNPYNIKKIVTIEVGNTVKDIYDTVAKRFVARNVSGQVKFDINANTAAVMVITPAGGKETKQGGKFLVNGVIVDFQD